MKMKNLLKIVLLIFNAMILFMTKTVKNINFMKEKMMSKYKFTPIIIEKDKNGKLILDEEKLRT